MSVDIDRRSHKMGRRRRTRRALLSVADVALARFFEDYNRFFASYWHARVGHEIRIVQDFHSGAPDARPATSRFEADVVSLSASEDVEALRSDRRLIAPDWQSRLPRESVPFRSRLVFLVHAGNPKRIKDWTDLAREDVRLACPHGSDRDPLAELRRDARRSDPRRAAVAEALLKVAPSLAAVGRRHWDGTWDVLVTLGSEATFVATAFDAALELVVPRAEVWLAPRVAVVDGNVDSRGTRTVAEAYAAYLYSPAGQQLAARHHFVAWLD